MNYVEIILRLNKLKKVLFVIFLIFMMVGYLLQKFNSKIYEFNFDIFFPSGSFLIFTAKQEIYKNFQNSILTELAKKDYTIEKKTNLSDAYKISTTVIGNNSEELIKKKKEISNLFQLQKNNLILWIGNNYNITNITLKELPEVDSSLDSRRKMKLELMWINLEKEYVFKNITEEKNLKFPKQLILKNQINYYAIMVVMFVAFITLFISYIIISEDIKKKIKKIKKT